MEPKARYTKNSDVSIAYYVLGDGPRDLLVIPGFISHFELMFEDPAISRFFRRLASFSRVIAYDKRNTGLSDRGFTSLTLDDYLADAKAVLDATGSEQATIFGISEGGPAAITLAATYPERARGLVLYGTYARVTQAEDYPIGVAPEAMAWAIEYMLEHWGSGVALEAWAPSVADDPQVRTWWARLQRMAASPADLRGILSSYHLLDVRSVLPTVTAPTLIIHNKGDIVCLVDLGRYLGDNIPDAKYVELDAHDHFFWTENPDDILDEIEEFVTGDRHGPDPDRKLATILFTDIVGSTEKVAAIGDNMWREVLHRHHQSTRQVLERFGGREVDAIGDGFLALFEGPTSAIRAADAIRSGAIELGLQIRAGVHTGEVELMDDGISGIAVHIAARVAAHAGPGEVWVSEIVPGLVVGSGIEFEDRGRYALKGVPHEWSLHSVNWADRRTRVPA